MDDTARHFRDDLAAFAELTVAPNERRGRPPAPAGERRDPFSLRLTAGERALVVRAAAATGAGSPAEWARRALLEAARAEPDEPSAP